MELFNGTNILALYLPAFHRIKENDEWWGEGFTEWDNVKKGKPLFHDHFQPIKPLQGYYDLSKVDSIRKQAELAKHYGVTGFIFYHYWFSGHKLLEKPAELLLDSDIDIELCFCWANEPWTRTWDGKNKSVLMPQEYGDEKDWLNHINYLIPFFRDKRYIRIDGHPVFFVYSASRIPNFDKMISFWNSFLSSSGEQTLYIVEFISSFNQNKHGKETNAVVEFEPLYTTRFDLSFVNKAKRVACKKIGLTDYQKYDSLWKRIIHRKRVYNTVCFKSCFVAWDNSPRKGKKSMIVKGSSPTKFEHFFLELLKNDRKSCSNRIVMINAWNEWGEGAILEPSNQFGFGYLEAISHVLKIINNENN